MVTGYKNSGACEAHRLGLYISFWKRASVRADILVLFFEELIVKNGAHSF